MLESPTHEVTVVVQSSLDDPHVSMEVQWRPLLSSEEIQEMGYVPAAYQFVQQLLEVAELASTGDAECELVDSSDATRH